MLELREHTSFTSDIEAHPPIELRILHTFRFMTLRRLEREYGGIIENRQSRAFLLLLILMLQVAGWTSVSLAAQPSNQTSSSSAEEDLQISVNLSAVDNALILFLSFVLLFVTWQVAEAVKPVIYWLVLGLVGFIILQVGCIRTDPLFERQVCRMRIQIVTYLTLAGVAASVSLWLATHKTYPWLLRNEVGVFKKSNLSWWWSIRPVGPHRPTQFSYRPSIRFFPPILPVSCSRWLLSKLRVPPRHFGYDGELDDQGRPDGVGTWNDSAKNGETLYGVWRAGEPIGPFRATEYATGFSFKAVRVAYVHNRAEPLDEFWYTPTFSERGLIWGVCSVECSIAGNFFKHLPRLIDVIGPAPDKSAAWCLQELRHLDELGASQHPASLTMTATYSGIQVAGFEPPPTGERTRIVIEWVAPEADDVDAAGAAYRATTHEPSSATHSEARSRTSDRLAHEPVLDPASAASGIAHVVDASRVRVQIDGASPHSERQPPSIRLESSRMESAHSARHSRAQSDMSSLSSRELTPMRRSVRATTRELRPASARDSAGDSAAHGAGSPSAAMADDRDEHEEAGSAAASSASASDRASISFVEGWYLGHEPPPGLRLHSEGGTRWTSTSESNYEAVVFLHGFNSPVSEALKRIGQLWTLGDFPPHLKPFCFGWPAAKDVTYFQGKRMVEDNERMSRDFAAFLSSLRDAGCRSLHVIAHSMGAMLLFSALPFLDDVLERAQQRAPPLQQPARAAEAGAAGETADGGSDAAAGKKLRLKTTLLMNPDAPLDRFLSRDYVALRRVCAHITLYADHSDGALWYSETFNRTRALGRHPFELVRAELQAVAAAPAAAATDATHAPEAPESEAAAAVRSHKPLGRDSTLRLAGTLPVTDLTQPHDPQAEPLDSADADVIAPRSSVRGAPPVAPPGYRLTPLDLDVIDVSWMETNVHAMRHNFFNVNRWMVDDLREILTTTKRARLRTNRMTHRFGNVWSFLAAPTHIVNP